MPAAPSAPLTPVAFRESVRALAAHASCGLPAGGGDRLLEDVEQLVGRLASTVGWTDADRMRQEAMDDIAAVLGGAVVAE